MKYDNDKQEQKHLRVYEDRSEYHAGNGELETFQEGAICNDAKKRSKKVKDAFEDGFLNSLIDALRIGAEQANGSNVSREAESYVNCLVDSLTSEVGRALIGLSVM